MADGIHELTAGYALDALDGDERRAYEEHLAGCERCRDDLASFWDVTSALAVAASGPEPSPELRERVLASVRAEPQNVVPLAPRRRGYVLPAVAAVAAVAAAVAIGLGVYALSLSNDLDDARSALSQPPQVVPIEGVDILVAEAEIKDVEAELGSRGWRFPKLTPYNERFYREWMHESPPMMHPGRQSVVDVHHAILPKTSRLQPSSARLLEHAVAVRPGIHVLCPAHMVLHSAAHLFHDGEIAGAIRDLVDLDGLLRHFAKSADFWPSLLAEAPALGLTRPAFYAVHHTRRMLDTPVPADVLREIEAWAPPAPVAWLMEGLIERAVQGRDGPSASYSAFALYVRSHWLKMPPMLLARHLARKAFS